MKDKLDDTPSGQGESNVSDDTVARLLGEYVDRYAAGEVAGPWHHMAEQSDSHPEILRELETIAAVGSVFDETTIPSQFGDFRILREIGRGGMGIVYEAVQHSLGRRVALKVMPARLLSSPRAVARFTREARAAGGLNHPNIVGVYSMGVEGGTPYYTMELSSGETLQHLLDVVRGANEDQTPAAFRRTPRGISSFLRHLFGVDRTQEDGERPWGQPPREPSGSGGPCTPVLALDSKEGRAYFVHVAEAFVGAAEGLQYAHEHGVIHRDLKPSNLVLDERSQLRILDFGVARVEGLGHLTVSDERVGTPLYMSPEQAQDPPGPMGPGTDIYSLGATLYEMVALSPPHRGRSTEETLRKIAQEDPPAPRKRNPRVPRDLETIVLRCLRKDPRRRYGSAEALAEDLRHFSAGEPIAARPLPFPERVARRAWQSRKILLRIAGVLAVAAGLSVLSANYLHQVRLEKVQRFEQRLEEGLRGTLRHQLRRGDPRMTTRGTEFVPVGSPSLDPPSPTRSTDGSTRFYESAPGVLEVGLSLPHNERDHLGEAERSVRKALEESQDDPIGRFHLAHVLVLRGKLSEALKELDFVRGVRPDFVPALAVRARALELQGEASAKSAWEVAERVANQSSEDWPRDWLRGYRALWSRRWEEAAKALSRVQIGFSRDREPYLGAKLESLMWTGIARLQSVAPAIAAEDFRAAHYTWSDSLEPVLFLGQARYLAGHLKEADELFEASVETAARKGQPSMEALVSGIIGIYKDLGDQEAVNRWIDRMPEGRTKSLTQAEALALQGRYEEARRIVDGLLHGEDALFGLLTLGNILLLQGKLDSALETFEAARREALLDPRPPLALGVCRMSLGDPDGAERWIREAIRIQGDFASAHYNLGRILDGQGKLTEAIQAYNRALELNPYDAQTSNNLGTLYDRKGDLYLARRHYEDAVRNGPRLAAARFNLAWLRHREYRFREAEREYRAALDLGLDNEFIHGLIASALLNQQDKFRESAGFFEKAIERNPQCSTNYFDLGILHFWTGAYDKAGPRFRQYLERVPGDSVAWGRLGEVAMRRDLRPEAVAAFRRALELNRRNVSAHNQLAELTLESGEPPESQTALRQAIVELEDASRLDGASTHIRTLLEGYRSALSPGFASHASLDAALETYAEDPETLLEKGKEWLLLAAGEGGLAPPQRAYLRGRLQQLAGDVDGALADFEAAATLDPSRPEPYVRAADCLVALEDPARAEQLLRSALNDANPEGGLADHDSIWEAWFANAFRAYGGQLQKIPSLFPAKRAVLEFEVHDHARDILWLVERVAAGDPIRINCGGKNYATERFTWSGDRLFRGGSRFYLYPLNDVFAGRDDAALYQTERYFAFDTETDSGPLRLGYRIPVPQGRYEVRLHFVEGYYKESGTRVFDVLLEGDVEIPSYEPVAAGFGEVAVVERTVAVEDGALDIDFRAIKENPKLSAFEVRRLP